MDGGQSHEILTMRTIVDWCLTSVMQSENIISKVADLYIKGDKDLGLKNMMFLFFEIPGPTVKCQALL